MKKVFNYIFAILSAFYLFYIREYFDLTHIYLSENIIPYFDFIISVAFWYFVLNIVWYILDRIVKKVISKTHNLYDDIVWKYTLKAYFYSKYVLVLYIAILNLNLSDKIAWIISSLFWASFVLITLFILTWLISSLSDLLFKNQFSSSSPLLKQVFPLFRKILIIFLWLVWGITFLSKIGYNVSALITWAWIWGLAFALAAQKSISNIFWAVTILLNNPFKIGDFIQIDNIVWTVKEIWLTYMTIVEKSWNEIVLPNEKVISTPISNYSVKDYRRCDFAIWVVYDTSLEDLKNAVLIIEKILQNYVDERTISDFRVNFDSFWDFSLNINATYFSSLDWLVDFLKQKEEINFEIKKQFEENNLNMAFPTSEVILKKED